jgi:hypothetical protein
VRGFGGETDAAAGGGVIGRWGGFAESSATPANVADVVDKLGSFGVGKSTALLALAGGSQFGKGTDFFVSHQRYRV